MDDDLAKGILRAIMERAEGWVGEFVDLRELSAMLPFSDGRAEATLAELVARRWVYRRADHVAVSRPAVEYAIEWPLADRVLRAIAATAGQGGHAVSNARVIETAGLPVEKTNELMAELSLLDLAGRVGQMRDGVYISGAGMLRLADSPKPGA